MAVRLVFSFLAMILLFGGVPGRAVASISVDLGTAGRAASFQGAACGGGGTVVLQLGESIGLAASALGGFGRCGGGAVASAYFALPTDAKNIRIRIDSFAAALFGELRLNGKTIQLVEDFDDGDGRDGKDAAMVGTGFLPGARNLIEIAFGGLRSPDDYIGEKGDGKRIVGRATLQASLIYDSAEAEKASANGVKPGNSTKSAQDGVIPEPGSFALLLPGLALLLALGWRVSGTPRRARSGS